MTAVCGACGVPLSEEHNRTCLAWQANHGPLDPLILGVFFAVILVIVVLIGRT